jgi:hypothetical protein
MLRRGSWFAPLPWCNITLLFERQWTLAFGINFSKAQKTPTRRPPELAPELPSAAMSLYEKESREADAKLTELWKQKKPGEKVAHSRGDTVNSPLPESCVLFVRIYSAQVCPLALHRASQDRMD